MTTEPFDPPPIRAEVIALRVTAEEARLIDRLMHVAGLRSRSELLRAALKAFFADNLFDSAPLTAPGVSLTGPEVAKAV
jgi:hypothetical protein